MKKIYKLFLTVILLAICACGTIPFAACGDGEWIEVQSVSYNDMGRKITYTSTCEWEIEEEDITKSEYDNAPEENKVKTFLSSEKITTDRQDFINYANSKTGMSYSTYNSFYFDTVFYYYKHTIKSYKLDYVKVKILEKDSLEINYNNKIIQVSPSENGYLNDSDLPYEITYFEN